MTATLVQITTTPRAERPQGAPTTWPLWRFGQCEFGERWYVAPAVPDAELAARGFRLGGPYRDASRLEPAEQAELLSLVRRATKALAPHEMAREMELLGRCPFAAGPLPPLDLDCKVGVSPETKVAISDRIHAACAVVGLGQPDWHTTGGKGLHGDMVSPVGSVFLLQAVGRLVRRVAETAKVPLLSSHRTVDGRPDVVLDDTLFDRVASARGVVWRLAGSERREGGRKIFIGDPFESGQKPDTATLGVEIEAVKRELAHREGWPYAEGEPEDATVRRRGETRRISRPGKRREHIVLTDGAVLGGLAAQLQKLDPPKGQRHEARLAIAGWLLRAGIEVNVVASTLTMAFGDLDDSDDAAQTTSMRLDADEPVKGWSSVARRWGPVVAASLQAAFARDLAWHGYVAKSPGDLLTPMERNILRRASELATTAWETEIASLPDGHPKLAKKCGRGGPQATALRRALKCGRAKDRAKCSACDQAHGSRWIAAETALCPHCATSRAAGTSTWIAANWPQEFYLLQFKVAETTFAAAKKEKDRIRRMIPPHSRGKLRFLLAPGVVCLVTTEPRVHASIASLETLTEIPRLKDNDLQRGFLVQALLARGRRLRQLMAAGDARSLAEDDWVTRSVATMAGKQGRREFPWPTQKELRAQAIERARRRRDETPLDDDQMAAELSIKPTERRSPCCQAPIRHELLTPAGEVVASRLHAPYGADEADALLEAFREHGRQLSERALYYNSDDVPRRPRE